MGREHTKRTSRESLVKLIFLNEITKLQTIYCQRVLNGDF
jgi:hypothetical protein